MRLNPIMLVGVALIVLGVVAFAYQGITYTSRERVVDIGPFPCHRRHPENDPALTSIRWVGACRWNRVGRGWSQRIFELDDCAVQCRVCDDPSMNLR